MKNERPQPLKGSLDTAENLGNAAKSPLGDLGAKRIKN
jgi:hypothetical protein